MTKNIKAQQSQQAMHNDMGGGMQHSMGMNSIAQQHIIGAHVAVVRTVVIIIRSYICLKLVLLISLFYYITMQGAVGIITGSIGYTKHGIIADIKGDITHDVTDAKGITIGAHPMYVHTIIGR